MPRLPNGQGIPQAYLLQSPRTVSASEIFWLNMDVDFTSVVDEITTQFTETEGFDMIIRGAWTNLVMPRVKFLVNDTRIAWQQDPTPLNAVAGSSDEVTPAKFWHTPVLIKANALLEGQFTNSGGEAAGRVCFLGEQAGYDQAIRVSKSQHFYALVNLASVTTARTAQLDHDTLIWGASTNISSTTNLGIITNESTNRSWSSTRLPLRAFAGLEAQVQPIMWYRRPYYLPRYVQLRIDMDSAPAAGSYMTFIAERIFK